MGLDGGKDTPHYIGTYTGQRVSSKLPGYMGTNSQTQAREREIEQGTFQSDVIRSQFGCVAVMQVDDIIYINTSRGCCTKSDT